jgi:hypothetical protein
MTTMRALLPLVPLVLVAACGSTDTPTADVSGKYTLSLTKKNNGCAFANWTVGETSQGVVMTVTQNANTATGTVEGLGAVALDLVLGTHVFSGTVTGSVADLQANGSRAASQGTCAYTVNAHVNLVLTGNAVNGSIVYAPKTNGSADCGVLNSCTSTQDIAGSRPPK